MKRNKQHYDSKNYRGHRPRTENIEAEQREKNNEKYRSSVKTIPNEHEEYILSLCLLGNWGLASCGKDGKIIVYDLKNFENIFVINNSYDAEDKKHKAHQICGVHSICGLKNGNLASADCDGVVKIWEIPQALKSRKSKLLQVLKGHESEVYKVIELEDEKLCSSSYDRTIKIWDEKNYECIKTLKTPEDTVISLLQMNDYLVSAGISGYRSLRLWNLKNWKCKYIREVYCCYDALTKTKDNKLILGGYKEFFIVDLGKLEEIVVTIIRNMQFGDISSVLVSESGKILLGNYQGMIISFQNEKEKREEQERGREQEEQQEKEEEEANVKVIIKEENRVKIEEVDRNRITCIVNTGDTIVSSSFDRNLSIIYEEGFF